LDIRGQRLTPSYRLIDDSMLAPLCGAALVITISNGANVPRAVVDTMIAEANAIWRPAGLAFVAGGGPPGRPALLDIDLVPVDGRRDGDAETPIAWVPFVGTTPLARISVSYANARAVLRNFPPVAANPNGMPPAERDTYLGRAMGRALAHELGHYLLASRAHTRQGLMQAVWSANDLFGIRSASFELTSQQRAIVRSRLDALRPAVCEQENRPLPDEHRPLYQQ